MTWPAAALPLALRRAHTPRLSQPRRCHHLHLIAERLELGVALLRLRQRRGRRPLAARPARTMPNGNELAHCKHPCPLPLQRLHAVDLLTSASAALAAFFSSAACCRYCARSSLVSRSRLCSARGSAVRVPGWQQRSHGLKEPLQQAQPACCAGGAANPPPLPPAHQ